MKKIVKLHATLLLALFLAFSLPHIPLAHSEEETVLEKAHDFLTDVVGLDLTKYNVTLKDDFIKYPSNLGGLSEEHVKYTLESNESKIDVIYVFVNGTLANVNFYLLNGSPAYSLSKPANDLDATKGIFQRFQAYSNVEYPPAMSNLLDLATPTEDETTLTLDNIKLDAAIGNNNSKVNLVYSANGVDYRNKGVIFKFKNGNLRFFANGWSIYKIGSDVLNVTQEKAIKIAREAAPKNISYEMQLWNGTVIEVTNVTIVDSPVGAEVLIGSREPLTLYPYWHISLYFDKVYPGDVFGYDVYLWADTGEVISSQPKLFMGSLPETNSDTDTTAVTDPETSSSASEPNSPEATNPPSPQFLESQAPILENDNDTMSAVGYLIAAAIVTVAVTTLLIKRRKK